MRVVFFVKKINSDSGEYTSRSFVREDVKNPFAYRKVLLRNEVARANDNEMVTVGFDTNPDDLRQWKEENPLPERPAIDEG